MIFLAIATGTCSVLLHLHKFIQPAFQRFEHGLVRMIEREDKTIPVGHKDYYLGRKMHRHLITIQQDSTHSHEPDYFKIWELDRKGR